MKRFGVIIRTLVYALGNAGAALLLCGSLQYCANPVPPAGGDKDTAAPVLVSIQSTTKTTETTLSLEFDENVTTVGNLVYSPRSRQSSSPNSTSVKVQRNSVDIRVPESVNCVYLDNWIVDLNEKNPIKNSTLLLNQDSGEVIIKLKNAKTEKVKYGVYIFRDTLIYYPQMKKNNTYHFQGLPQGIYQTVIIENDNNQKIENNESYNVFYSVNRPQDTLFVTLYPPIRNYKSAYSLSQDNGQYCVIGSPVSHTWLLDLDSIYIKQDTLLFARKHTNQIQHDLGIDSFISTTRVFQKPNNKSFGILDGDTLQSWLGLYGFNSIRYHSSFSKLKNDSIKRTYIQLSKNTIQNNSDSTVNIKIFNSQINYIVTLSHKEQVNIVLPEGTYNWVSWINSYQISNYPSQPLNIDGSTLGINLEEHEGERFYFSSKPWIVKKNLDNTLILPDLGLYNTGITTK